MSMAFSTAGDAMSGYYDKYTGMEKESNKKLLAAVLAPSAIYGAKHVWDSIGEAEGSDPIERTMDNIEEYMDSDSPGITAGDLAKAFLVTGAAGLSGNILTEYALNQYDKRNKPTVRNVAKAVAAAKPKPKPKSAAKPKPKAAAKPKPKAAAKPKNRAEAEEEFRRRMRRLGILKRSPR